MTNRILSGNKFYLSWSYEAEHTEEKPIDGETFIPGRLWGTKPNGELTLLAEFSVPVKSTVVDLILAAAKLVHLGLKAREQKK